MTAYHTVALHLGLDVSRITQDAQLLNGTQYSVPDFCQFVECCGEIVVAFCGEC